MLKVDENLGSESVGRHYESLKRCFHIDKATELGLCRIIQTETIEMNRFNNRSFNFFVFQNQTIGQVGLEKFETQRSISFEDESNLIEFKLN